MGACHTFYDELRFDVTDPHQTHLYVYIRCQGDCPHFIQGWHHKVFPHTMNTKAIFDSLWNGEADSDPVLWEMKAPPSDERNRTLDEVTKAVTEEAMQQSVCRDRAGMVMFDLARKIEGMKTQ